ncbi:hypothetical protein CA13_71950 [Planctomycetes bacterium CA13]|uniref:GYF domain-containing protein n=1 Tax=Novipirellula herctigrandis TaxID=2527986 RepID=A0A5C5YPJ9_9BACT|nr:hypothetical protein CA13_71950 [Planctomycetes bacterium CA13]
MAEWYIQQSDAVEDIGPLRPSDLLKMVRGGEVTPETRIRKDDSAWFNASEVGGLFEAAMRPTIEYFCPQCERPVHEPPVVCPNCGREIHRALTKITENTIASGSKRAHHHDQPGKSVQNWLKSKMLRRDEDPDQ